MAYFIFIVQAVLIHENLNWLFINFETKKQNKKQSETQYLSTCSPNFPFVIQEIPTGLKS